jgi:hypothetical protein
MRSKVWGGVSVQFNWVCALLWPCSCRASRTCGFFEGACKLRQGVQALLVLQVVNTQCNAAAISSCGEPC